METRHLRISPTWNVLRPLSDRQCAATSASHDSRTGSFCSFKVTSQTTFTNTGGRVSSWSLLLSRAHRLVELESSP